MTQNKEYKTADLYYAAYLKTAAVLFLGTHREKGRVFFVFEHTDMIPKLKLEFFNRTAKVPALTFADEIRIMKSLTHM